MRRPGYVGYDEGGQLTEAVRRRPYSVVLLDEIEKAHPDVFNALLQVMDDGRLTDGQGRTVSFKNTVLIMTSNIPGGRAGVEAHFKPEFINRLDDIVEFHSLTREQISEIVDLQVARLIERVRERGIEVELTDKARTLLGNLGYDPTYGARPLKRVIQKRLVDPLALAILEGRFATGDTVRVDAADGELVLERAESRFPPTRPPLRGGRLGLGRAHAVVARVVLDLGQAETLEDRRDVVAESAPQALLQPVPPADRIVRRAGPRLDRSVRRRLLLVGVAQRDPVAARAQHRAEIVDCAQVVAQLGAAHLHDQRRRIRLRLTPRQAFGLPRRVRSSHGSSRVPDPLVVVAMCRSFR